MSSRVTNRPHRILLRWLASGSALALVASGAALARGTTAGAEPTGTSPIGVAPKLPPGATTQGAVAADVSVRLTVVLKPQDPTGLAALAAEVSDPSSPEYRHYLPPGGFAQRFGPSADTIGAVDDALSGLGLHAGSITANHLAIPVTTTAGQADTAFGIQLRLVHLADGRVAYANDAAPQLPVAIAPAIADVVGLDDLAVPQPLTQDDVGVASRPRPPAPPKIVARAGVALVGPQPCSDAGDTTGGYTADQLAQAYGFEGLYARNTYGGGVTVALYELSSYNSADIAVFQNCYGTNAKVTDEAVDGGTTSSSGDGEVELDIEGVIGMAPEADIEVYIGPNTDTGAFDVYNQIVGDDSAQVVSSSWAACETEEGSSAASMENTLFQEAALQGQTVLVASGDSGSEGCYYPPGGDYSNALAVMDAASQPYVTGVGGTTLDAVGPPPSETAWNEGVYTGNGAGGGGISQFWPMPSWQQGPGVVSSWSSGTPCGAPTGTLCREVPDVSASADPTAGYVIYYTGTNSFETGWQAIGGTSGATPLWASVIALADQDCDCQLGFVNPALYKLATSGPGFFNDVTSGNNDYTGTNNGAYPATSGYDMATGLGSPIADALADGLDPHPAGPVVTSDATDNFTVGASGSFTVTATGSPVPTLAESGTLPPGVSFDATTGVLSGTPGGGSAGSYAITFTATNGAGEASQSFTLTVAAAGYTPLAPARDLDTRDATGGTQGPVAGNTTFNVSVAGVHGVPAGGVGAVALNVTVTDATCAAWLTVFPTGQPVPASSNLNYAAGETIANLVIVGVGTGGKVSFNVPSACHGSVQVVADVQGWYAAQSGAAPSGTYTALTPARDLDTRNATGATLGPVAGDTTFNVTVGGVDGVPAGGVGAVALNVTVTDATCAAWLTVFPTGQPVPASSNLNYAAGETIANLVIVGVGTGGKVSFNVPSACHGSVQVVADVQGWYAAPGISAAPGSYTPLTPARELDTRNATGGTKGPVAGNKTFNVTVGGVDGVPAHGVGAVALNVTVTNPTCAAWLTVFPTGQPVPASSNLNYTAGETIPNLVIVGVGTGGQVSFNVPSACAGAIQVIGDIQGWYGPTP